MKSLTALAFSLVPTIALAQSRTPAHVITVDQSTDSPSGDCEQPGTCNLRAALAKANALGGNIRINVKADSEISGGEIAIQNPALELVIAGSGRKTLTGNGTSKLFTISPGAKVSLRNLQITGFQAYNAGAISNAGTLTLARTTIQGNTAKCFGNGAMTAFATCWAGAIENSGALVLKNNVLFESNLAEATASTAAFTNANVSGGAIVSSGSITFDGDVTFRNNIASAIATSGFHGQMPGGSSAASSGGALSNSGTIAITDRGQGKCQFEGNEAKTLSSTPKGEATQTSRGGAVATQPLTGVDLLQSCTFVNNQAGEAPDVFIFPAS